MNTNKSKTIALVGLSNKTTTNYSYRTFWKKLHESDRNNIRKYRQYRKGIINLSEDDANSLQMEIISELADVVLENEFGKSCEDMCDDNGSFYEEYQDRFNELYDDIEDKLLNCDYMKPNQIAIPYKSKYYTLNRVSDNKYYQMGFEADRWSIRIYLLQNGQIRIIIDKSIKKSETEYHTQFCYDCYCTLDANGLFLDDVCDPATCRKIKNPTKWFTIEPMLKAIYSSLKEELNALHQFDLIHDIADLEHFICRRMKEYGTVEFTVNNSLHFGIGENAYSATEDAMQAKEKEPIVLLDLFNGNHVISKDTIVFFLHWLLDRDKKLSISDGEHTKDIVNNNN
jgi:hypothetical protein